MREPHLLRLGAKRAVFYRVSTYCGASARRWWWVRRSTSDLCPDCALVYLNMHFPHWRVERPGALEQMVTERFGPLSAQVVSADEAVRG